MRQEGIDAVKVRRIVPQVVLKCVEDSVFGLPHQLFYLPHNYWQLLI